MIYRSLRQGEATARRGLLQVTSYDVALDLARDDATFESRTRIDFTSTGGDTWVDLRPARLHRIALNGEVLDPDLLEAGRYPLRALPGPNEFVVEATMAFRNDGEGLHRSVDPADGRHYVYGMCFMEAAPSIFACFDQPDLKAPWTFHVRAPRDWVVVGNAPGVEVEPGTWEFSPTPPLSTYFVTIVAGPYHVLHDEHDGIPLGLSARASLAADLDREADELFELTRACFDEFHRLFGIRYPFGDYHQAFVPEFNAGAMENPGCVTFRDPLVFSSQVTRGQRIGRATTVAHEMAHQWFGDIVTPVWWDDLWLNESFAEYLGNRVTADVTRYGDAWTHNAYSRRQWGLIADQRPSTHPVAGNGATDAAAALGDFDGISYAKGSAVLKQLNATIGDDVFLAGTIDHIERNRFGNATMHDLFASWERAGAGDLSEFITSWLRTSGADTFEIDRDAGVIRRIGPAGGDSTGATRTHAVSVASSTGDGPWSTRQLVLDADETPYDAPSDEAIVLDPYQDTWALTMPDDSTLPVLASALPHAKDPLLRAGAWSNLATAFHNARLDPAVALDILEPAILAEDNDDALTAMLPWGIREVAALSADPAESDRRLHEAALARAVSAEPGSTLQLAAFRGAIGSAATPSVLRGWLAGDALEGVRIDLDLRWAILARLAQLGATTRDELDQQLAAKPTTKASVAHTWAVASLPDPAAKAWAWERFTGATSASNYHIEAAGHGLWRRGHEALTAPYADAWLEALPALHHHHEGWVLGTAVQAFAPVTVLEDRVVAEGRRVLGGSLAPAVRRGLTDSLDAIARRIAVVRRYHP